MEPILLGLIALALAFAAYKGWQSLESRKSVSQQPSSKKTTDEESKVWPDGRPWGVWTPQKYIPLLTDPLLCSS